MSGSALAYVVSFLRMSTSRQRDGDSWDRQENAFHGYLAVNRRELLEQVADIGRSAWKGAHRKRGYFGKYLDRVKANKLPPHELIVEDWDRFSRELLIDAQQTVRDLVSNGVTIVILSHNDFR